MSDPEFDYSTSAGWFAAPTCGYLRLGRSNRTKMRRVHGKANAFAAQSEPCPVFALDEERRRMGPGQDVCLRVNRDAARATCGDIS